MWVLWVLGTAFESYVGSRRMIIVYGVSLLWGAAGALLFSPGALTIGASGAIFGLMGAMVVMFRQRGIAVMQSGLGVLIVAEPRVHADGSGGLDRRAHRRA